MKKNNWWNRLFHPKKIKANWEQLLLAAPKILEEIGDVTFIEGDYDSAKVTGTDSLIKLLEFHKAAWAAGFQNKNLGPDPHGLFRTKSIADMRPQEVFLGGIYGLWENPIPTWEGMIDEGKIDGGFTIYRYLTIYQIILRQYKRILAGNIRAIAKNAEGILWDLESLGY